MKLPRASLVLLATAAFAMRTSAQTAPVYEVRFLGSAGGATDLNIFGQVIGTQPLGQVADRAWVASPSSPLTYLPLPPGRISSRVYDINDVGAIVGTVGSATYADPHFGAIAALWTPNGAGGYTVQELGKLPGDLGSVARALNDAGDVVGESQGSMYRRAVWFAPSGILDLTPTGAFEPVAINEQRVVVCYSTHCSRLDLDTMVLEDLGLPAGSYWNTDGAAINESNQVAGLAILATSTDCDRQAARFTDGVGWQILNGCGKYNGAASLNDLGDVTMWTNVAAQVRFEGLGTFTTEALISAPVGHWYLFNQPGVINDLRQIAIAGSNSALGLSGVILLTPQGEVGLATCFGDGSAGACPCNNASASGSGQGCVHSGGIGAALSGSGSANVADDDLVLHVVSGPAGKSAIFLQGFAGAAVPFADGLRCAASPAIRLQALMLDGAGAGASSVSIVTKGFVAAGTTRVYQTWFRDPSGPCGHTSNLSSGLRVDWQ